MRVKKRGKQGEGNKEGKKVRVEQRKENEKLSDQEREQPWPCAKNQGKQRAWKMNLNLFQC